MNKNIFFVLYLFLISLSDAYAQEKINIIQPSPQASEMVKYIDYPMDLSSGLPSINIPIYTINSNGLSIPISISYHADGLKPNENESGIIGLGWSLNAFGMISASSGKRHHGSTPLASTMTESDTKYLRRLSTGKSFLSGDPTIYSYNLPNGSNGKFVFNNSLPVQLPRKAVKINGYDYSGFEILDENGNNYKFGVGPDYCEYTYSMNNITDDQDVISNYDQNYYGQNNFNNHLYNMYDAEDYDPRKIKLVGAYYGLNGKGERIDTFKFLEFPYLDSRDFQNIFFVPFAGRYTFRSSKDYIPRYFHEVESSWMLKEIVSVNKKDTIHFKYDNVQHPQFNHIFPSYIEDDPVYSYYDDPTILTKASPAFSKSISLDDSNSEFGGLNASPHLSNDYTINRYSQKKLSKITFKSGYVNFIYKNDPDNVYPEGLLDKIEVFVTGNSTPIKIIKFTQTKYHNDPNKLNWYKLDEVAFLDSENSKINKYGFDYYNPTSLFPDKLQTRYFFDAPVFKEHMPLNYEVAANEARKNINSLNFSIDFWGYYNRQYNWGIIATIPGNFIWNIMVNGTTPFNLFGSANRLPNPDYAKIGVLQKITFPTGGERIFEYEGNRGDNEEPVGGLRVKSITNKTGSKETKRTFVYRGHSRSIIPEYFKSHTITNHEPTITAHNYLYQHASTDFTVSSNPNVDININGRPVLYYSVTEYDGDEAINNGWIKHIFDDSFVEKYPLQVTFQRDIFFPYSNFNSSFEQPFPIYYNNKIFGNIYEKETSVYSKQGEILKQTKNHYTHNVAQNIKGLVSSVFANTVTSHTFCNYKGSYNEDVYTGDAKFGNDVMANYLYYNYDIRQLEQKLDSTETIDYLHGNSISVKKEYTYNNYLFPKEQKVKNSDGSISTFQYKYPTDFSSQEPYNTMVAKNIIAPVIESTSKKGDQISAKSKTIYFNWGNNNLLPQYIQSSKGTNLLETKMIYNNYYSNGNVKEVSDDKGIHTYYIWGYKEEYPIAKIENFTASQATTIQSLIDLAVDASNNDNSVATENTLRLKLNDIRNSAVLSQAMVTTYTYDPLIGITSVTDSKGAITYYQYDKSNSLAVIRDQDYNILKTYSYNYKEQSEDGNIVNQIPAALTGLSFSSATPTTLNFTWNSVSGASAYKIYKNGEYVGYTSNTSGSISGLVVGTSYNIQVLPYNDFGEGTLCSAVAMQTTTLLVNACSIDILIANVSQYTGCTLYKNSSPYLIRGTTGTSTGTLAEGDVFYVTVTGDANYNKFLRVTSSVRGVLFNASTYSSGEILNSGTFTKTGSEIITINCSVE